jgi:hypothetical protein
MPDFDDLVGTDLDPGERERLRRVHEALLAAGPPPELSPGGARAPRTDDAGAVVPLVPRRKRGVALALAAALGVFVFALGMVAGIAREEPGTFEVVRMTGTPAAEGARATIELFDVDDAGNWPMEVRVEGLDPSPSDRPFELWLTSGGEPGALCGVFRVEDDGTTVIPMNAPYRLKDFDGWAIVEEGSRTPLLVT